MKSSHTLNIKRFFVFLVTVSAFCVASAAGHNFHGEKTLGINIGYAGYNNSAMVGAEFSYRFNKWLRVAPAVDYVFRHHGEDALTLDINAQFPLNFSRDRMAFFPELGLNVSSWNFHDRDWNDTSNDVSARTTRIGMNIGAGYEIDFTPSLRAGIVGYYTLLKDFSGFNAALNIAYRF